MRCSAIVGIVGVGFAPWLVVARAADPSDRVGCTGPLAGAGGPACTASWEEKKWPRTEYALTCEYACARARDAWHAHELECRCHPPAGTVYVKKRLFKSEGEPVVERVPKYEPRMTPAKPCGCGACRRDSIMPWDPLGLTSLFGPR